MTHEGTAVKIRDRITESSHNWPGPPLNERPEWLFRAVSQIYAIAADSDLVYVGHTVESNQPEVYVGEVIVMTRDFLITTTVAERTVTTTAKPLSSVTSVEVVNVDHVLGNRNGGWPRTFQFKVDIDGKSVRFPVSNNPDGVQRAETYPAMHAVLSAMA